MPIAAQTTRDLLTLPVTELEAEACLLVEKAYAQGDVDAEDTVQRLLYQLNVLSILPQWCPDYWGSANSPEVAQIKKLIDTTWMNAELEKYRGPVAQELSSATFADWATAKCAAHASGPSHPLFTFLAVDATKDQLREFLYQETPFDIHFAELLSMLFPGLHGVPKLELARNFWDEMGNGTLERTHRQLRIDTMNAVGIAPDCHLTDVDKFWIEEIRLANMYFGVCSNRQYASQAMGMLLATELVVPGRIDRQVDGWKRVGVPASDLTYLTEHVTVDVGHAQGWMDEVVTPLLDKHPDLAVDFAIGVQRRLDVSLEVCDRAVRELIA